MISVGSNVSVFPVTRPNNLLLLQAVGSESGFAPSEQVLDRPRNHFEIIRKDFDLFQSHSFVTNDDIRSNDNLLLRLRIRIRALLRKFSYIITECSFFKQLKHDVQHHINATPLSSPRCVHYHPRNFLLPRKSFLSS